MGVVGGPGLFDHCLFLPRYLSCPPPIHLCFLQLPLPRFSYGLISCEITPLEAGSSVFIGKSIFRPGWPRGSCSFLRCAPTHRFVQLFNCILAGPSVPCSIRDHCFGLDPLPSCKLS